MENLQIIITDWATHQTRLAATRQEVFVIEQKVPVDVERDAHDVDSVHILAVFNGVDVGAGRLLPDGHIGRLAVRSDYRGMGIGTAMMQTLIQEAHRRGLARVELSSQLHARAFYEGLGFTAEGQPFMEAGITHIHMYRVLANG